jgi:hypothetical protein
MVALHAIEITQDLGSRAVELEIIFRETGNYLQSVEVEQGEPPPIECDQLVLPKSL